MLGGALVDALDLGAKPGQRRLSLLDPVRPHRDLRHLGLRVTLLIPTPLRRDGAPPPPEPGRNAGDASGDARPNGCQRKGHQYSVGLGGTRRADTQMWMSEKLPLVTLTDHVSPPTTVASRLRP